MEVLERAVGGRTFPPSPPVRVNPLQHLATTETPLGSSRRRIEPIFGDNHSHILLYATLSANLFPDILKRISKPRTLLPSSLGETS